MGRLAGVTCGVVAVALLSGCGGGSGKTSSTSSVVTTAPATSVPEPAITGRLLTAGEMPAGFTADGDPSVAASVQEWVSQEQTPANQVSAETARYKRIGFVSGATLNLNSSSGAGLSLVEQFRSSAGARLELANEVATFKSSNDGGFGVVTFKVPEIPGAIGFGGSKPDTGVNVAFAAGDYYYLVGEQPSAPANRAAVVAAAKKLYDRVHA